MNLSTVMRSLCGILITVLALSSMEAGASGLEESIRQCRTLESAQARLECYDAVELAPRPADAAASGSVAPATVPSSATAGAAPTTATATAPASATAPEPGEASDFGREHWEASRETPDSIRASVAAVARGGYGKLVITLDNGQVWQQRGSEKFQLSEGDAVVIERGALNSFFLSKADGTRKLRVSRLR